MEDQLILPLTTSTYPYRWTVSDSLSFSHLPSGGIAAKEKKKKKVQIPFPEWLNTSIMLKACVLEDLKKKKAEQYNFQSSKVHRAGLRFYTDCLMVLGQASWYMGGRGRGQMNNLTTGSESLSCSRWQTNSCLHRLCTVIAALSSS